MSTRTVIGRLAAEPIVQAAGCVDITRLTVMENTGRYRQGAWVANETPTAHQIEAEFELGAAAAQLRQGQEVIVVGNERTTSWQKDGEPRKYRRVITAEHIAVSLSRPRVPSPAAEQGAVSPADDLGWEVTPIGRNASAADPATGFTGFGNEIDAELRDARTQLASAQALNDYEQAKYWNRAVVDLERADEGRS